MAPSDSWPRASATDAVDPRSGRDAISRRARAQLAELFDRHESAVFGFLVARTGDRALSEDLTTETFLALARRAAHEPAAVDGLAASNLITIARRRLIDHWRATSARQRRLDIIRAETLSVVQDPGASIEGADERVLAALESLPPRQRAALTMRHLEEMAVSEVAEVLGSTYRAAESILARARSAFKDAYDELGDA